MDDTRQVKADERAAEIHELEQEEEDNVEEDVSMATLSAHDITPSLHKEVSAITMCVGGEEGCRYEGGLFYNGLI